MNQHAACEFLCTIFREPYDILHNQLESLDLNSWEEIIQQSIRQGITPLLYQKFSSQHLPVPKNIMEKIHSIYFHRAVSRNIRLYHHLSEVLRAFRDNDIPVIVLKGAHLAEIVYGNIALRRMSDIDLLVQHANLAKAERILLELGYKTTGYTGKTQFHLPPFIKAGNVQVEIHWTLTRPALGSAKSCVIDMDGLWKRKQRVVIAGVKTFVLSPEDLLIYLCIHLSVYHRFDIGMIALFDICKSLEFYQNEIKANTIVNLARSWKSEKPVYLVFCLAENLLNAAIPAEIMNALKPSDFAPVFIAWAKDQIFGYESHALPVNPNLAEIWRTPKFKDRISIFLKKVFPRPRTVAELYPLASPAWIYLYYPLRIKHLLNKYFIDAWRLLRKDKEQIALATQQEKGNALVRWLVS